MSQRATVYSQRQRDRQRQNNTILHMYVLSQKYMMSTLSADPVASMNSLYGLNAKQFTYSSNSRHTVTQLVALTAYLCCMGVNHMASLVVPDDLVSQLDWRKNFELQRKNLN